MNTQTKRHFEKALGAGSRGDYEHAVRLFQEVLASGDAPENTLLYLGRAWHRLGDYAKALSCFQDYRKQHPSRWAAWFFTGRTYLALGMPGKASRYLNRALKKRPGNPMVLFMLGMASLKAKRSARALHYLERALESAPEDRRIYQAYLSTLMTRGMRLARRGRDGDVDMARQMLSFVIDNGLDGPLPHLELGRMWRREEEYYAALCEYVRAAEFSPEDSNIRWCLASLYAILGDNEAVSRELENLRLLGEPIPDMDWTSSLVDHQLIRSHMEHGQFSQAEALCRAWLKTWVHSSGNKETPEAKSLQATVHLMLSECLRNLDQLEMAEKHARRALQLSPEDDVPALQLAVILWDSSKLHALETHLAMHAEGMAASGELPRFKALLAWKQGVGRREVISLIQEALRSSGPVSELCLALGECYLAEGLPDLAETWYRKAHESTPDIESAWLGEIAAIEVQIEDGDRAAEDRLISCTESYLVRWEDNLSIRREFALFLVHSARWERALIELKDLLTRDTANTSLRRLLARVYGKCGDYQAAAILFKGLLKERPRNFGLLQDFVASLHQAGACGYALAVLEKARSMFPQRLEELSQLANGVRETQSVHQDR